MTCVSVIKAEREDERAQEQADMGCAPVDALSASGGSFVGTTLAPFVGLVLSNVMFLSPLQVSFITAPRLRLWNQPTHSPVTP